MKMDTSHATSARNRKGFTLIEMIGVLAIISILAAALLPRVFKAVTDAQINNVAESVGGVKAGITDYYAANGHFPDELEDGTAVTVDDGTVEQALIQHGVLEQIFDSPVGTDSGIGIVDAGAGVDGGDEFDLDGDTVIDTSGRIARAWIGGVSESEAFDIDRVIDGRLGWTDTDADGELDDPTDVATVGRVIFDDTAYPTDVYVYLAHR